MPPRQNQDTGPLRFYRKFGTLLRVDLDPLTHRHLIAESTKRGMRPKALLTKLIEEAASPEAKALVGIVEAA